MGDALIQHQIHEFLGGRRHVLIALAEGHHGKAEAFQVLRHLNRAPAVEGNLRDVVAGTEILYEFFDISIVDHIALGGIDQALPLPDVVRNMIPLDSQINGILRQPEEGQDFILPVFILGREYQHEGGNIRRGGKVEAAIAEPPAQALRIDGERAGVPLVHRHPARSRVRPLAQMKLPELHFLGGILLGGGAGGFIVFNIHGLPEGGIDSLPDLGISPVGLIRDGIHHRVEGGIMFPAFQDVDGLGVYLVADGILVRSRRGNDEIQGLLSGRAGALRHDVEQLAIGLAQQFVEDAGVDVVSVFRGDLGGKRLVDGSGRQVDQALLAFHDFDALEQRRALQHHVLRHVEYDAGLLAVIGAAIDFRAFLAVAREHVQRHGGGQFGFARLLAYLDKGRVELPVSVFLDRPKQIPDNLFLPVK